MMMHRPHPNADLIARRAPAWRIVQRLVLTSIALTYGALWVLRLIGAATGLFSVDASDDSTPVLLVVAITYSVGGLLVVACIEILRRTGSARPWLRLRTHALTIWAHRHGHRVEPPSKRAHVPQPVLGAPRHQRIRPLVTWRLDDGRQALAFEARYHHDASFGVGGRRFLTGVALELDPAWVTDLPQVTVSPSAEAFVAGAQAIRDRRWELGSIDACFQVNAAISGPGTELALTRLFDPATQLALGQDFCAYWQQTGAWLLVWIPERSATLTRIEALHRDATWLRERYRATLPRSAARTA